MIHGLGGTMWNYHYALVEKLTGEFRVITVDRPGSGYSVRPDDAPATLSAQAATLAKFIKALGVNRPLLVRHFARRRAVADHRAQSSGVRRRAGADRAVLPMPRTTCRRCLVVSCVPSPVVRKIIGWTLAIPMSIRKGPQMLKIVFGPDPVPADYSLRGGGISACGRRASTTPRPISSPSTDLPALMTRYSG